MYPGFAPVSKALWLIEQSLEEEDPRLMNTICDVSVLLLTKGMNRIYEVLDDRICSMVEIRALKQHQQSQPQVMMFAYLKRLP